MTSPVLSIVPISLTPIDYLAPTDAATLMITERPAMGAVKDVE